MRELALGMLCMTLLAAAPLTDHQQQVLEDTPTTGPTWDQAGLYALLDNVLGWGPGDRQGGRTLEYASLVRDAAAARGELFLVEARFGQRERVELARPGPWGSTALRWDLYRRRPKGGIQPISVLFPGSATLPDPRPNQPVRIVARFYKLWQTPSTAQQSAGGGTTAYPLFVGARAELADLRRGGAGAGPGIGGAVLVLMGLLVVFWRLRRLGSSAKTARGRLGAERLPEHEQGGDPEPDLPRDPAEALAELARRRERGE